MKSPRRIDPQKWAAECADIFMRSLEADLYPPKEIERMFGVVKSTEPEAVGKLVFNVWIGLWKTDYFQGREDLTRVLLTGDLPKWFEAKVLKQIKDVKQAGGYLGYYLLNLIDRGFAAIPWDYELLDLAKIQSVMGLVVDGSTVTPKQVVLDASFQPCPIAAAAGIPLVVKKLQGKGIKSNVYIISRMMSEPLIGLARREWSYGGTHGVAPQVLAARRDNVAFEPSDWYALDDFEMEMLDDGPRRVTRDDFVRWAKSYSNPIVEL
ncbi:hypothetical protein LEN26_011011 [Aphanomyces euteiches]|nr:hypothetical protein AeMF1_016049 [Aphanomyces euteiches]KAH9120692.1 hypothetical protein LEN26_011011 [Aphanomyces euteiches]KAH9190630.1 hypothetical protein AeNC1_007395 [Aphanomyces euteiches]